MLLRQTFLIFQKIFQNICPKNLSKNLSKKSVQKNRSNKSVLKIVKKPVKNLQMPFNILLIQPKMIWGLRYKCHELIKNNLFWTTLKTCTCQMSWQTGPWSRLIIYYANGKLIVCFGLIVLQSIFAPLAASWLNVWFTFRMFMQSGTRNESFFVTQP